MPDEITKLRAEFQKVGDLAIEMVRLGGNAYFTGDRPQALKVIELEKRLNREEMQLEAQCQSALTTRRLDAPSVRWVLSILRSAVDLERVGDHCFKLAQRARERGAPLTHPLEPSLRELSRVAVTMLLDVLRTFYEANPMAAHEIGRNDETADRLKNEISAGLQAAWKARNYHPSDYEVLLTSLDLERVADHATNIAEEVMALTSGTIERHTIRRERESL